MIVLELVQVVGQAALFGDDRKDPDCALSIPRLVWEEMDRPLTMTVDLTAGGEFTPRPAKQADPYGLSVLPPLAGPGLADGAYL